MNHFVHIGTFNLFSKWFFFYCIMLSVKVSSHDTTTLWLHNILCLLFFLVNDFLLYVTTGCHWPHATCIYNGIHISHVFLPQLLLFNYLYIVRWKQIEIEIEIENWNWNWNWICFVQMTKFGCCIITYILLYSLIYDPNCGHLVQLTCLLHYHHSE